MLQRLLTFALRSKIVLQCMSSAILREYNMNFLLNQICAVFTGTVEVS